MSPSVAGSGSKRKRTSLERAAQALHVLREVVFLHLHLANAHVEQEAKAEEAGRPEQDDAEGPHPLGRSQKGQGFQLGGEFDGSLQTGHGLLEHVPALRRENIRLCTRRQRLDTRISLLPCAGLMMSLG